MRFDDVELGIPGRRMRFAFPSPVWVWQGCSVEADALGPFGCEDVLSLCTPEAPGMSTGCRKRYFAARLLGLLVCYGTLAGQRGAGV